MSRMNRLFVYYGSRDKYSLVAKKIALINGIIIEDVIGYIARIFRRITKDELHSYGLQYFSVGLFPVYGIYNGFSDTDSIYEYSIRCRELNTPLMIKNTLCKLYEPEIYIDTRRCAQYMSVYCVCKVDMNDDNVIDVSHIIEDEDEDLVYTSKEDFDHSFGYEIMRETSNEMAHTLLNGLHVDDYVELGEKLMMRLNEIIEKRNLKMKVISFPMLHLSSSDD